MSNNSLICFISTVFANSNISLTFNILLSINTPKYLLGSSFPSNNTSPFLITLDILLWAYFISTNALSFPLYTSITICNWISLSNLSTKQYSSFISLFASFICSSFTSLITSSSLLESPAKTPIIELALIPTKSPVLGTVTHIAFFIIFPLHFAITFSGIFPNTSLAFAAAYAIAIGSVHPIAGTNSSFKICK